MKKKYYYSQSVDEKRKFDKENDRIGCIVGLIAIGIILFLGFIVYLLTGEFDLENIFR
jgi:hypothetical protein